MNSKVREVLEAAKDNFERLIFAFPAKDSRTYELRRLAKQMEDGLAALDDGGCCEWEEDLDGLWNTTCGQTWLFNEGGPKENKVSFCFYCGNPVRLPPPPAPPKSRNDLTIT